MPARHFFCCLPLRLGALLISFCQLALCGLIAAGGWYTVSTLRGRLPNTLKAMIFTSAVYYSILALASLIGLLGTIARKASLLSTYAFWLGWSIGVQIVIDALFLWAFFSKSRDELIERCIDGSTEKQVQDICNSNFNAGKWTVLVGLIVGLLIQSWAAYIVSSYAQKLRNEKTWRSGPEVVVVPLNHNTGPKYTHVKQEDESHPLTGASYAYPYRDGNHSFGNSNTHHQSAV
ncbi:hypothetical protein EDB92DRAFT_1793867 [Lactarius akahatsu]|uniref:Uncharacterized protein n=1 Tax=Lactarius akahatsu TaxID=416441 RepID=A0AAD4QG12_9AGAM|nr:hypothetical protein EDB92DRAFT_1793867 [Lactarius akahatsu]